MDLYTAIEKVRPEAEQVYEERLRESLKNTGSYYIAVKVALKAYDTVNHKAYGLATGAK